MTDWNPATDTEAALREALAGSDQEQYFRILSRTELLLPVSVEALAGRAPMGWGTWTTGNRTHILAFTSPAALQACLNEPGGTYRTVPFHTLAAEWPNYEWWLAVNPGLPIEAYLPSWFVSQLTRGNIRLPGRTMGARARMAQSELAAALNGRIRAAVPPPTVVGEAVPGPAAPSSMPPPVPAQAQAHRPIPNGHPVETVDAEIIDYPPAPPPSYQEPVAAPPRYPEPTVARGSAPFVGTASPTTTRPAPPPTSPPPTPSSYAPSTYGSASAYDPATSYGPTSYGGGTTTFAADAGTGSVGLGPTAGLSGPSAGFGGDDTIRYPRTQDPQDAEVVEAWGASFSPANETEANLLAAAEENNTDAFLSTLLLARVILPVPAGAPSGVHPRDPHFPWQIEDVDGGRFISLYTSPERLAEHSFSRFGPSVSSISLRFVQVIAAWPDEAISFAINPGSPVGATLPGSQIVALAAWATEVGLRDDPSAEVVVAAKKVESTPNSVVGVAGAPTVGADRAIVMQRTVPHAQVPYYLERGYDRVSGFVNRASEVSHVTTPRSLYRALGLVYVGGPFTDDDTEVHVLRWVAHRADLYRLPYGGQHEAAMRAMQGWVIERAPFRGNGFAPGDTDVVAEFKVDSVRLPHGAQMWRLAKDGTESLVATFDADYVRWNPAPVFGGYGGSHA